MNKVMSSALLVLLFISLVANVYGQSLSFQPAVSYGVDTVPNFTAVGDFNGDGVPDLAVANQGFGKVIACLYWWATATALSSRHRTSLLAITPDQSPWATSTATGSSMSQ